VCISLSSPKDISFKILKDNTVIKLVNSLQILQSVQILIFFDSLKNFFEIESGDIGVPQKLILSYLHHPVFINEVRPETLSNLELRVLDPNDLELA